jgi:hypothetical protein
VKTEKKLSPTRRIYLLELKVKQLEKLLKDLQDRLTFHSHHISELNHHDF